MVDPRFYQRLDPSDPHAQLKLRQLHRDAAQQAWLQSLGSLQKGFSEIDRRRAEEQARQDALAKEERLRSEREAQEGARSTRWQKGFDADQDWREKQHDRQKLQDERQKGLDEQARKDKEQAAIDREYDMAQRADWDERKMALEKRRLDIMESGQTARAGGASKSAARAQSARGKYFFERAKAMEKRLADMDGYDVATINTRFGSFDNYMKAKSDMQGQVEGAWGQYLSFVEGEDGVTPKAALKTGDDKPPVKLEQTEKDKLNKFLNNLKRENPKLFKIHEDKIDKLDGEDKPKYMAWLAGGQQGPEPGSDEAKFISKLRESEEAKAKSEAYNKQQREAYEGSGRAGEMIKSGQVAGPIPTKPDPRQEEMKRTLPEFEFGAAGDLAKMFPSALPGRGEMPQQNMRLREPMINTGKPVPGTGWMKPHLDSANKWLSTPFPGTEDFHKWRQENKLWGKDKPEGEPKAALSASPHPAQEIHMTLPENVSFADVPGRFDPKDLSERFERSDPEFKSRASQALSSIDFDVMLTTSHRTEEEQQKLVDAGKGSPTSLHPQGRAIDISGHNLNTEKRQALIDAFEAAGFYIPSKYRNAKKGHFHAELRYE